MFAVGVRIVTLIEDVVEEVRLPAVHCNFFF